MELAEKLRSLPDAPGVYLFSDARGALLYIGKAVSLRKRVQSYFGGRDFGHDAERLSAMVAQIADVDFVLTAGALEALILESNLVKERRPRYNIVLRDDKHYPFIRLNPADPFPALQVVRRIKADGALYYGPYVPAGTMWSLLALIHRTFPLRTCPSIAGRSRCLEYHLGRCLAPCEGLVGRAEYAEIVGRVRLLLEGKDRQLVRQLTRRMDEAAERLEFEQAARLRDQIASLQQSGEVQRVITSRGGDHDVFGAAQDGGEVQVQLFVVRGGKLIGRDRFAAEGLPAGSEADVLGGLLPQFYLRAHRVPRTILVSHLPPDAPLVEAMLAARAVGRVTIKIPERGAKARLVAMAVGNAQAALAQSLASAGARRRAMEEVRELLGLPGPPRRIECVDISNTSGALAVGSLVAFLDGQPRRGEYKRFRIRTVEGADDYAMLGEVLRRRLSHREWPLPDLLLIDGGRGQLSAGLLAAKAAGMPEVPLASLAKEEEVVFRPGCPDPIRLPEGSRGRHLLQQVRDESHRFALAYHRQLRGRAGLRSALDEIPGIGPRRKGILLKRFGSVQRLCEASVEELQRVGGLPIHVAEVARRMLQAME
jgi:excinuclease ABC subunit C